MSSIEISLDIVSLPIAERRSNMIARNNRNIYSGKKAPSAALTLFGPKVEPKGYIKHSRLLSYSQRVFRVEPIITMLATQCGA